MAYSCTKPLWWAQHANSNVAAKGRNFGKEPFYISRQEGPSLGLCWKIIRGGFPGCKFNWPACPLFRPSAETLFLFSGYSVRFHGAPSRVHMGCPVVHKPRKDPGENQAGYLPAQYPLLHPANGMP